MYTAEAVPGHKYYWDIFDPEGAWICTVLSKTQAEHLLRCLNASAIKEIARSWGTFGV